MDVTFGQQALISMLIHLAVFAVTFWALQSIQLDKLLKKNRVAQGRLLYILLTIAIGSAVSRFLLDYYLWTQQLPTLFE
ncbi:putative integral membrane protein (TIGR02327 family) [Rossellomorea marisflavi]